MIFRELEVENIGPFQGRHRFDLFSEDEASKNVVVVAGHNGAGKTTLFRLIPLALHGSLAIGDRAAVREYHDYIRDLLHREERRAETSNVHQQGSIKLVVSYVLSGVQHDATVTRTFIRNRSSVREALHVETTEEPGGLPDPQAWITDRIPLSHVEISFFDAEDLQGLIGADGQASQLRSALYRLLGIHLTDRLQDDLQNYIVRSGGTKSDKLRSILLDRVSDRDQANQALEAIRQERVALGAKIKEVKRELAKAERALAAEGGSYAEQRAQQQADLAERTTRIESIEGMLREEAEGLLPFAFLSSYRSLLRTALDQEEEARDSQAFEKARQAYDDELRAAVASLAPDAERTSIVSTLESAIQTLAQKHDQDGDPQYLRHDLRSSEAAQIRTWLNMSASHYQSRLVEARQELKELRKSAARHEQAILRAPQEQQLTPIHNSIKKHQQHLDELQAAESKAVAEEARSEVVAQEAEAEFLKARKAFEEVHAATLGIDLAARSRNVLETYRDALLKKKLEDVAAATVSIFNSVCMKEHLLEHVAIDPSTFQSTLFGASGDELILESFSAGERQLYNLSLVGALRFASNIDLPLFIDTPFARLDDAHRNQLLNDFVPNISKQVVLFATDAEYRVLHEPRLYDHLALAHVLTLQSGSTTVDTRTFQRHITETEGMP